MKQICSLVLCLVAFAFAGHAQVTFSPPVFTAEDEVTLTVDVTGTPMAGQPEAYIWMFSNVSGGGKDGFTNTSWTNSPATAKMTPAGTNKWSFKFTGTTMFSQTPAELKDFGFLVKAKDGSKQSPDYKPFAFDPLIFAPAKLRVFPAKVDRDDVVTVNFDQALATTVEEQRMAPVSATIALLDNTGAEVGTPLTIATRKIENTVWAASFIPSAQFTPGAGRRLARFKFKFNGTVRDTNGANTTVSSSEAQVEFVTLK
ncbi:hypothetical protein EXU57_13560 [Segetibacter sp. 3557_3]|uniref:hypothetical protein n=1 Tax=Segetibacter sp. 3557_3 TaxID=2547429 RepID=UPI001058A7F1|nr:hypothetical protein [Segetibacter sp. 3557_3]TDH25134.1 hypothetical protein EXU57_13560 [Segetibacter sp. 3557_3]